MIVQPGNTQIKPYEGEVDRDVFPEGDYLQVDVKSRDMTWNSLLWQLWDEIHGQIQPFSAMPFSLTSELTQDAVRAALASIDKSFAFVFKKVRTHANEFFSSTFGGPQGMHFEPYPIRWPGENRFALKVVLKFAEALHQIPMVRANVLDNGVPSAHAGIVARPIYYLKEWIMREVFQVEIKGMVSPDELDAIFRDTSMMPPLTKSIDDRHDTRAEIAAEDERALTDESVPVPTPEVLEAVKAGKDVWTWVPTGSHWAALGEILERTAAAGPHQRPGEPFGMTTGPIGGAGAKKKTESRTTTG